MTAPRSPGTASDPPGGSGLAWGGPARRPGMTTPRSPGTASDPPGGSGLAWGSPARRPGMTAPRVPRWWRSEADSCVGPAVAVHQVLLDGDRRMLGRVARLQAGGQALDHVLGVAGEEERDRVPFAARDVDDPVQGGLVAAVGPTGDQVADVDHVGAGHRRCVDPAVGLGVPHLQATAVVLREQGDAAEVGVRATTLLARRGVG